MSILSTAFLRFMRGTSVSAMFEELVAVFVLLRSRRMNLTALRIMAKSLAMRLLLCIFRTGSTPSFKEVSGILR